MFLFIFFLNVLSFFAIGRTTLRQTIPKSIQPCCKEHKYGNLRTGFDLRSTRALLENPASFTQYPLDMLQPNLYGHTAPLVTVRARSIILCDLRPAAYLAI